MLIFDSKTVSDSLVAHLGILPILHINVVNILRQQMLVKSPIDSRNAVREYVVAEGSRNINHIYSLHIHNGSECMLFVLWFEWEPEKTEEVNRL